MDMLSLQVRKAGLGIIMHHGAHAQLLRANPFCSAHPSFVLHTASDTRGVLQQRGPAGPAHALPTALGSHCCITSIPACPTIKVSTPAPLIPKVATAHRWKPNVSAFSTGGTALLPS